MLGKRAKGQRLVMVSKRGRRPTGKSGDDRTTAGAADKFGRRRMTRQARGNRRHNNQPSTGDRSVGDGVFAATVNDNNTMVAVVMRSFGHPCPRLRRRSMAMAVIAVLSDSGCH